MKRCPKCNRSFPDDNQKFCTVDGGSLVLADKPFDPNATIQGGQANLRAPLPEPPKENSPGNPPTDFGATIATTSSAPTVVLPRKTGPTGSPTSSNFSQQPSTPASQPQGTLPPQPQPPARSAPLPGPQSVPPSRPQSAPLPLPRTQPQLPPVAVVPQEKSKLPLILGSMAIFFLLAAGALIAGFFMFVKPWLEKRNGVQPPVVRQIENQNVNTTANNSTEPPKPVETKSESEYAAPPHTTKFINSRTNLDGKLAERYFDFSFYYPDNWTTDPKAGVPGASNFAKVERELPPDFTQENFAVGWYTSKGTFEADKPTFPQLVKVLGTNLAKTFPGYRMVSEGQTKVNSLDGYEFRFVSVSKGSEKGDIQLWGRVIFLPTGVAGDQTGATLVMLTTSLAPELSGVEDVGEKGQMPVILESFRFGKSP